MEVGQGLTIGPRKSFRRRRGSVHAVASCVVLLLNCFVLRMIDWNVVCSWISTGPTATSSRIVSFTRIPNLSARH